MAVRARELPWTLPAINRRYLVGGVLAALAAALVLILTRPAATYPVLVADSDLLAAEQALGGSPAKSRVEMEGDTLGDLRSALAEAAGKFDPDRTVLPLHDPAFSGVVGRTIGESVPDWTIVMNPRPPEGAPNVLVVLIDDAGFGNPDTFGGIAGCSVFT